MPKIESFSIPAMVDTKPCKILERVERISVSFKNQISNRNCFYDSRRHLVWNLKERAKHPTTEQQEEARQHQTDTDIASMMYRKIRFYDIKEMNDPRRSKVIALVVPPSGVIHL